MRQTVQDINEVVLSQNLVDAFLETSYRKFAHSSMRYGTDTFAQFSRILSFCAHGIAE